MTAFIFITVVVVLCVLVYRNTESGFSPSELDTAQNDVNDGSRISPFVVNDSNTDIDIVFDIDRD